MRESPAPTPQSKWLVVLFSAAILILSSSASVAGALSIHGTRYRSYTTARSEHVEVADSGVYRHSVRALVTSGAPWDVVRLAVGIPLFLAALVLYLRSSIRGTLLFVGCLASFAYQYLLWSFDWAYNSFYLAYVLIFSLSFCTLVLVVARFDVAKVNAATGKVFPRKRLATFCFAIGAMLALKCMGEILPGIRHGVLPDSATGYYTLVDQGLDLGLLVPACMFAGVLVLRRNAIGLWLAPSLLVVALTIGASVVAGEAFLGLSTGIVNVAGLAIFSIFLAVALALLIISLRNVRAPAQA